MKILFDLISTQKLINGGAEYTIKIFNSLIERCINSENDIIAIYDSRIKITYAQVSPDYLENKLGIRCVDISNDLLSNIIQIYKIDVFFIGIGQRMNQYSLENINCKVICVIHDLIQIETEDIKLHQYLKLDSWFKLTKALVKKRKKTIFAKSQDLNYNIMSLVQKPNVEIVTVSAYSKFSLLYYYENLKKDIKVLHSPEKEIVVEQDIDNVFLKGIIQQKKKYFLIVSADRELKNAEIVITVFKKFSELNPDFYLLTIGYAEVKFNNHLILPYISASDLEYALMNSYAMIYPSLYEGFGYPPIEAMKYSKPVMSSNVCSMPEILGDAPIYFSPIYKADIFKALHKIIDEYDQISNKSQLQYLKINDLQNKSLNQLVNMILS
jgi:glycosyltransferase involved in cell wall biosynthesis